MREEKHTKIATPMSYIHHTLTHNLHACEAEGIKAEGG